eukprot:TRINITY_DN8395_c0_g1_i1.p1 TRINITY_DN8395_c0_g1~~TRINITY_DN8395_c0_g1_i1.p1  ORF type:complete len:673 (-),score=121.42 TRINITY_DN8395_c0_g1_i1:3-2021(-)
MSDLDHLIETEELEQEPGNGFWEFRCTSHGSSRRRACHVMACGVARKASLAVLAFAAVWLLHSRRKHWGDIPESASGDFLEDYQFSSQAKEKIAEKCFKNLTFYVELSGHFLMPHSRKKHARNAVECQEKCARHLHCEHFSFWNDGGCLFTSYSAYAKAYEGPETHAVIAGPRVCREAVVAAAPAPASPAELLTTGLGVTSFAAKEAPGCGSLHEEYELAWRAQGNSFFDDWQFINKSETRGAEWYLNRSEAFYEGVVTASELGATLRVGEQVQPFKRRSVMLHSKQAWRPDVGFVVVMRYKHVPYGPGVWPAFWLLNSDVGWPRGGELDILEYANDDTAKMTFHTNKNCSMNLQKLQECSKSMHDVNPKMILSCYTNYSGNQLGCMPPQVRKTGEWFSKNPGAIALVWDASGITSFHIPESEIPADLESDKPKPNTWRDSWRFAYMPFDADSCEDIARPQEIVLNIAICGDWAGNTFFGCKECRATGYTPNYCIPGHVTEPATDCCTLYISNPSAEKPLKEKAYFDISYVKVFTPKGVSLPKYAAGTYRNNGAEVKAAPEEIAKPAATGGSSEAPTSTTAEVSKVTSPVEEPDGAEGQPTAREGSREEETVSVTKPQVPVHPWSPAKGNSEHDPREQLLEAKDDEKKGTAASLPAWQALVLGLCSLLGALE